MRRVASTLLVTAMAVATVHCDEFATAPAVDAGPEAGADVDAGPALLVFVTKGPTNGNMGGPALGAARNLCAGDAQSAFPGRNFVPGLCTAEGGGGLVPRLPAGRRWILPGPNAPLVLETTQGGGGLKFRSAVNRHADGTPASGLVWTGCNAGGFVPNGTNAAQDSCNSWTASSPNVTGRVGRMDNVEYTLAADGTANGCGDSLPIYCFEVP